MPQQITVSEQPVGACIRLVLMGAASTRNEGQPEGQFEGTATSCKCNDPNGLSRELTDSQSLESYQLDDLPAAWAQRGNNKNEPRQLPVRDSHDSHF